MNRHHPNNDWHQELCALAAIGEASPSELEELRRHLAECAACRELDADFRRIASEDLGAAAVLGRAGGLDDADNSLDEHELLSRLLRRASGEGLAPLPRPPLDASACHAQNPGRRLALAARWLRRPAFAYGTIALLLCSGAALGAYRLRGVQLTPAFEKLNSQVQRWKARETAAEAQTRSISESLREAQSGRESAQESLAEAHARYAQLQAEESALNSQLVTLRTQLDRQAEKLKAAKSAGDYQNEQIAELEIRVQNAADRAEEQRRVAENLQARLEVAQQRAAELRAATPAAQGFSKADADALFGARDLHIVDVYDVGANGKTKRTYGRVYYVEKKLLIFYAFDLQDKRHNRAAAGFQAWGYRQASERKAESLGLFHLDDAASNRWVLKVSDPLVLQHVDAVYVTLEPPDGSPFPRGRRLLYADLAGPPNHP